MPAIQVLGCCSRLGTWSAACRRAGFLRLSSKTCRDGARGFLPATGTGDTAWGTVPWPMLEGWLWRWGHTVPWQPCPRCPKESCGTGVGFGTTLELLCCKDGSRTPAIPAAESQEYAECPHGFCPAEERGEIGVPLKLHFKYGNETCPKKAV